MLCGEEERDAAAGKISSHRDLVLSANPDNRFLPWAVEEGGRLGADAEALVDTLIRAGCPDPASRRAAKTYWMRALAVTTARGVARVLQRRRLPTPRLPSNADAPGRPSAASLAICDAGARTGRDVSKDALPRRAAIQHSNGRRGHISHMQRAQV